MEGRPATRSRLTEEVVPGLRLLSYRLSSFSRNWLRTGREKECLLKVMYRYMQGGGGGDLGYPPPRIFTTKLL